MESEKDLSMDEGFEVEIADQERVQGLRSWVDRIMKRMGYFGAFITDETIVCDFIFDDEELEKIAADLGIEIEEGDLLVDAAQRLRDKESE